jgi:hypothetical protein
MADSDVRADVGSGALLMVLKLSRGLLHQGERDRKLNAKRHKEVMAEFRRLAEAIDVLTFHADAEDDDEDADGE